MITYVDTSSLLKLLVEEDGSQRVEVIWDASDLVVASTLVVVEARAALAAAARQARLSTGQHRRSKAELMTLIDEMTLVEVTVPLIADAAEVAERDALRGYDAVHLASALLVGVDLLTSADGALCDAAARRGLHVANPLEA